MSLIRVQVQYETCIKLHSTADIVIRQALNLAYVLIFKLAQTRSLLGGPLKKKPNYTLHYSFFLRIRADLYVHKNRYNFMHSLIYSVQKHADRYCFDKHACYCDELMLQEQWAYMRMGKA